MIYWIGFIITLILGFVIFRVIVRRDYLQHRKLRAVAFLSEFVIFGVHANLPYLYFDQPWPTMPLSLPIPFSAGWG